MGPRNRVSIEAAAALLVVPTLLLAQQAQAPEPAFRSRTDLVTVDVSVLDQHERPVETLRPEDLVVLVDGAPRRVAALARFVAAGSPAGLPAAATADQSPVESSAFPPSPGSRRPPDESAEPSPPPSASRPAPSGMPETLTPAVRTTTRHFVIVVDRDHIRAGEGQQALDAAARFVAALPASDRVAAWTIPGKGSRLSFEERRDAVTRKIRSAIGTYLPPADPGAPGSAAMLLLDRHQRAESTLGALRDLLIALRPYEGQKHLVLVSGGGTMDETNYGSVRELATLATASRAQVHALHVGALPATGVALDLQGLHCECRDESILTAGALGYELSLLTGGFGDTPSRGLVEGAAFERLGRQLSAWYVLGFEPVEADRDGKPHRVEVRFAGGPEVTVRARRTFYVEPSSAVNTSTNTARPAAPPPALEWNAAARQRAQWGMMPFAFLPDWVGTAERFCGHPGLGADVEAIAGWETARLRSMLAWLQWLEPKVPTPPLQTLRQASQEMPQRWMPPSPARAAMLHTGAFVSQVLQGGRPEPLHLEIAAALLSNKTIWPVESPLRLAWYRVTPQWLLAHDRHDVATRRVEAALREYPDDPDLVFLSGWLSEAITSPLLDPVRYNSDEWRTREREVKRALGDAEHAYRRVLDLSPTHAEARVRLGKVLEAQGRPEESRAALEGALALGAKPDTTWLAHMLLGRVQLRGGRVDDAIAHYRSALEILPSQSASIALAHALERAGQREAARRQLAALTPAPGQAPLDCGEGCDPWQRYDLADREAIAALVKDLIGRACEAR